METKKLAMLAAVGAAAYYFLYMRQSAEPMFTLADGTEVKTVPCGTPIFFDVPGYDQVWLTQLQENLIQFDGIHNVPYGPHELNCTTEPGFYQSSVYAINDDGTKGEMLGQTALLVTAGV